MSIQIKKKFIGAQVVDGSKVLFLNDEAFKALKADGSAPVSLFKLGTDDKLKFLEVPQLASDPVAVEDVARKGYVDAEVLAEETRALAAEGALDERLDVLEGADSVEGSVAKAEKDAKDYADAQLALLALPEAQRKHVNYMSGSDVTGNGSTLKPWKTLSYACSQITDSASISTTGTWAANSSIITVPSTAGIVVGQIISSGGSSLGFPNGSAVVKQILSATQIEASVASTAARTNTAIILTKPYCIEFDGYDLYDVVSLPPNVSIIGKNIRTSQVGTINATYTGYSESVVANAEIHYYNINSSGSSASSLTKFYNARIFNSLNAVGGTTSRVNMSLFSTDVVTQLHVKGGSVIVAGASAVSRLRLFHNPLASSATTATIYGGSQISSSGTWLSGNSQLSFFGGQPVAVPFVTWGETSPGVFRGRVSSYSGAASAWTTDVSISIASAATQVVLTGDGVKTINTLISEWNAANPSNLMALVEGNGLQVVPSGAEIVFLNGAKPAISFDSISYPTEAASIQGPAVVLSNARPEGIRYDDRARASYYGFRFYAENYGSAGNSISLEFRREEQTGTTSIAAVPARNGTRTINSDVITGLSSTSDLFPGMTVTGTGMPSGARILAVLSGSSIQLTANVIASNGTTSISFNGAAIVRGLSSTANLQAGMSVVGPMFGSTITISSIFNSTTVILSGNASSSATSPIIFGKTIAKVVTDWNAANPSNRVLYTSAGAADSRGDAFIPATATIALSGGGLFAGSSSSFNLRDAVAQLGQKAQESSSSVSALQGELDATQAGAGLSSAGEYVASVGSTYLDSAVSLKDADGKLDAAIKAEVDARIADVDAEEARALAAEGALDARLDVLEGADTVAGSVAKALKDAKAYTDAEQSRAEAAEGLLDGRLDVLEGDATVAGSVAKAEADAKAYADQKIADLVDSAPAVLDTLKELADALGGDENFAATVAGQIGDIQSELDDTQAGAGLETDGSYAAPAASSYLSAAVSLKDADSKLDAAISALSDALDAEVIERAAGDTDLYQALADEATQRDLLIAEEASARESADTALANNIADEVMRATAAEEALDGKLDQEIFDRSAADSLIHGRLDVLEGADTVEGSVAKALKDAKAYADAEVAAEETRALAAELALGARLDVIEGADTVEGSVAKALKDAKAYTDSEVAALVDSAPAVLDTLKELADALGGDENFATTIAGQIGGLDGRVDALEAASVEFKDVERTVLTALNLAYVDLTYEAIPNSLRVSVDRLAIHRGYDYTVSVVNGVTRITFIGSLVAPGAEALVAGDEVFVEGAKRAIVTV